MNENIEETTDLTENTGAEAQATEEVASEETVDNNEVASEELLTTQGLLEKALTELETVRKEYAELQASSQDNLKMIEKMIFKQGAVVPRDNKNESISPDTSAKTFNQPMTLEQLSGQLFIK